MQRNRSRVQGLTLVELLVSISLITVVASMFLVAYRQAAAEASNIRTQSTIRKISEVLVSRMQEYENYPINFARAPGNLFANAIPGNAREAMPANNDEFEPKGILLERLRVMLLREMIAREMPDFYQDIRIVPQQLPINIYWTGLQALGANPNGPPLPVQVTASDSPRANRIRDKLAQANPNWWQQLDSLVQNNGPGLAQALQLANAEFLYLIVEDSTLNGSPAIELFGKTEIGDTDGDGLLEFLDSYRQPICWVRWPTGFPETTRFHPDLLDPSFNLAGFANYAFSDPLDPRKADPGYRIKTPNTKAFKPGPMAFPLVISSGLDRDAAGGFGFGVRLWHSKGTIGDPSDPNTRYRMLPSSASVTDVVMPVPYDMGGQSPVIMCDPWFPRTDPTARLGAFVDLKLLEDDITNYSINGAYQ